MATMKTPGDIIKNNLDINTQDYYFNTMEPFLKEIMAKCHTDNELLRTVDKVMNACNSLCQEKKYDEVAEEFSTLNTAITDHAYFSGVMKNATEEEKTMVRELIEKINTLNMIIKCEPQEAENKMPETKKRLDYKAGRTPAESENGEYVIHNMEQLNKPRPGTRIPN